jgi:hypothetical protein
VYFNLQDDWEIIEASEAGEASEALEHKILEVFFSHLRFWYFAQRLM